MQKRISFVLLLSAIFTAVACLMIVAPASAAPINYGDFIGTTVRYLDVTEAANSPGDEEPLYGEPFNSGVPPVNPSIGSDTLSFNTVQNNDFSAVAQGPGDTSDTTIGTLSFGIGTNNQGPLQGFTIMESGDWGFDGVAGTLGSVAASLTYFVYSDPAHTNLLKQGQGGDGDFFSGQLATVADWSEMLVVDLSQFGVSSAYVVINNNLHATKTGAATSFIHKKQSKIEAVIPEPGTLALLGLGLVGLWRRR